MMLPGSELTVDVEKCEVCYRPLPIGESVPMRVILWKKPTPHLDLHVGDLVVTTDTDGALNLATQIIAAVREMRRI